MTLRRNNNQGSSISTPPPPKAQGTTKRVADIILNNSHPLYAGEDSIGIIFYQDVNNQIDWFGAPASETAILPTAKPLNLNNYTTPVIGELVQVIQSVDNNYYPDLGGNITNTNNYYTNVLNIHNNAGSNALPVDESQRSADNDSKRRQSSPNFSFQEEFASPVRETALKKLDDYLYGLGYNSGRSSRGAPTYTLFQKSNGDYVYRLDDTRANRRKLGNYYKENATQKNLRPSEGSTIIQGKDGQRINMLTTGPNGANSISRNVTDDESDGNPTVGDRAMIMSIGNDSTENIESDPASIYLLENQSVNINVASENIDSLKSEYKAPADEFEAIAGPPSNEILEFLDDIENEDLIIDQSDLDFENAPTGSSPQEVVENAGDYSNTVTETTSSFSDPVFDLLDQYQDEGTLSFVQSSIDISYGEDIDEEFGTNETTTNFSVPENVPQIITVPISEIQGGEGLYVNKDLPLGKGGYKLAHLMASNTAEGRNIANFPGRDFSTDGEKYSAKSIVENLDNLCEFCLDPLKTKYSNLEISSGLRVNELNEAISGSKDSEHRLGRAADISVPGLSSYQIFNYIVTNNIPYNQLIWEFPERENKSWVHISFYKNNNKSNRTIATYSTTFALALQEKYPGKVKFDFKTNGKLDNPYATFIGISTVPSYPLITSDPFEDVGF